MPSIIYIKQISLATKFEQVSLSVVGRCLESHGEQNNYNTTDAQSLDLWAAFFWALNDPLMWRDSPTIWSFNKKLHVYRLNFFLSNTIQHVILSFQVRIRLKIVFRDKNPTFQ